MVGACDRCLRRTWLLARLSGYLEHHRRRIEELLAESDEALVESVRRALGRRGEEASLEREYAAYGLARARVDRERAAAAGLELLCRCEADYPGRLRRLKAPPAVLHVAGGVARLLALTREPPVAVVGSRRAGAYGLEVAHDLARGISASGLSVVSGMAAGVDAAAHRGALAAGGRTVAVLPACAATAYPRANASLHRRILERGVAVSELGPGAQLRRWSLVSRNRVVASLSELVVVVQAGEHSGALLTAALARASGVGVGAVPGAVGSALSAGPHELIREGATLIRDARDALEVVLGPGAPETTLGPRATLRPEQARLLEAIRAGADTAPALARELGEEQSLLASLAELELAGCLRRFPGGRYVAMA